MLQRDNKRTGDILCHVNVLPGLAKFAGKRWGTCKKKKKLVNGKNICKWLLRNVGKWNVADHTLHTVGYTQRDNHSAIVSVKGKGTFKGSVPGDFFPRSASTSDVRAAASDMLRPTQTKHVGNFQATPSIFFSYCLNAQQSEILTVSLNFFRVLDVSWEMSSDSKKSMWSFGGRITVHTVKSLDFRHLDACGINKLKENVH